MSRPVRIGIIQAACPHAGTDDLGLIKRTMIEKHLDLIGQAAAKGAQVIGLQELFYSPYFPAEQEARWFALAEPVPDGPSTRLMMEKARQLGVVLIVPVVERAAAGIYYNTASVIDADGRWLGQYRKNHLPHCYPGFWEKFYFRPGNLGYPVFETAVGKIGISLCYDRHFPEGARALGLNGAEIVFNPSATVAGLSESLWQLEQPAHAVANQYFLAAINRVGVEQPWAIGEFYGQSYVCDPQGVIVAKAARDSDEVLVTEVNLALIEEVRRTWAFYRDRRPETYEGLTAR